MGLSDLDPFGWAAAERRYRQDAVHEFIAAITASDGDRAVAAIQSIQRLGAWSQAVRQIARLPSVSQTMQRWFLKLWIEHGDGLRDDAGHDRELIAALGITLPPYEGPALTLYRGDSWWNRRRRSYGMSWSSHEEVAEAFAQGMWRTTTQGSVVLRAEVPAATIIRQVHGADSDHYEEAEYWVDRRRLRTVDVLRRHAQPAPA